VVWRLGKGQHLIWEEKKMKAFSKGRILALAILFLVAGSSSLLLGQNSNTGEIRGFVTDTSGAAMPDVTVTFANVLTGVSTKVTTNASGTYDAPTLMPGTYSITFSKTGFTSFVKNGVTLGVQVIEENASLEVGAVTQEITVTAPTPLVQTETSESSATLSSGAVYELPNVSMQWYNLANLLPGVAPGGINNYGGNSMSVNGSAPYTSSWLINGATAMFTADNNNPDVVGDVPLDSIAEVKADTNSYNAAYGNGSSVFNVITKTGTNQWHGTLFEYVRNTVFNARNFFEAQTSPFHWNEFGGTVGGPIKRNKAFFFFSYQDARQVTYSPQTTTVPTADEEAGNFSNSAFPTVYDPASLANGVRTPLQNNTIPSAEISPWASKAQQFWPQPNKPGLYNNYFANVVNPNTNAWYSGSVQYHVSASNQLSVSVMFSQSFLPEANIFPVESYADHYLEQQHSVSDSWSISPTIVNDFHMGFLRVHEHCLPANAGTNYPSQLGELNPMASLFPSVTINGAISASLGPGATCTMGQGSVSPSDSLTIIKGKNILSVGGEYDRLSDNLDGWGTTNTGNFTFSGIFTRNPANPTSTGLGYADFLYGLPQTWSVAEDAVYGQRASAGHMFVQDDYKMRKNLTLNVGVRYTLLGGWGEVKNRISDFDPTIVNPATNTLGALWFGGQDGRTTLERTDFHGIQPRLGFAWSPRDNWTVRGAYGLFDQVWAGANYGGGYGQGWNVQGYQTSSDLVTPIFSMSPPQADVQAAYPSLAQGPSVPVYPHGTPSASLLNGQPVSYYQENAPIPYIQQAHFDVQHELPHNLFFDAGYVWTRGLHLSFFGDANQVPADLLGPGNAQPRRPYPQYESINENLENGISNYNAFVFTLKREFSQGLLFAVNYTWSKSMDTQTVSNWSGGDSGLIQITSNPRDNYGLANLDMPNIFNAYFAYQLPVGKGKHFANQGGVLNAVIGGWQLSSVLQVHSGSPFTPEMGTGNLSGSLGNNWYPNRASNGSISNASINEWFNTSAFVEPSAYTFGNSGRDILLGPSYKDLDLALTKRFPISKLGEGAAFEFRADATDLFNTPNFGQPNSSIGTFGVGVISSANSSRQFQLGARLNF
jgi:hypothetical protein